MQIFRARLSLLAATGLAAAILAFELPVGELVHQHGELSTLTAQLDRIQALDRSLSGEVSSLHDSATVAAIAHAQYGLVRPGQQAYALLEPGARSSGTVPSLVQGLVPRSDLVVLSAGSLASPAQVGAGRSLWSRVVGRLAFWRWAF
ncbi:MAG: septum formation initiator family protein [Acidimicrobiales bacterium]